VQDEIVACRRCPRLVRWRERVAREKVRRFAGEEYWGKPVPSFGDPSARLLVVGLAPAAHGANRTGRMFTGDNSGAWLYRALHRAGFANRPASTGPGDGLLLTDCLVSAAVRCAPPANTPAPEERARCVGFLRREMELLSHLRVIIGLGAIGFRAAARALVALGRLPARPAPHFGHGVLTRAGGLTLLASYHPSQQNTFTGRLTEEMFDEVFRAALRCLGSPDSPPPSHRSHG
jgi:uracil-DNA glycosylase family 4